MIAGTMTPDMATADVPFDVSVVTTLEDFNALADEWRDLIAHCANSSELFHDPAVIRLMLSDRSQSLSPAFVVVRRGGLIQCLAPFYVHRTKIPLKLSVIQLASFRARALRLFGDSVIFRAGHDPLEGLTRVFEALRDNRRSFDLIWVHCQRLDDPLWAFVNSRTAARLSFLVVQGSSHREKLHCLVFSGTFDEYLATVRAKSGFPGKTIKRFWRDMKDQCEVVRITQPAQVASFLSEVDRVYRASWQGRTYGGGGHNTREAVDRLEQLGRLGYLRSYLLTEQGRAVAFIVGYQYRDRYFYEETGYDSERSSRSPGSVLTHAAIEDLFCSNTPRELSFGFGDGAYKRTFGNMSYDVCSLFVVRFGFWRLILGAQQLLNAADEQGRALVTRWRLDQTVRRFLKRQQ